MRTRIAVLIFLGSMMLTRADQLTERVQQALKDQGFYYGEVTGETNANLTAAIRRYQIRNGLQVSGQLNAETLQSLGIDSGLGRTTTKPISPAPAAPVQPDEQPPNDAEELNPAPPAQPFGNPPPQQQIYPSNPMTPASEGVFAGTPFQAAPPPVQRNVVLSAQIALARRGLYRDTIDGVYGPATELSLRAYQAQTRLPVTGRLDLETLAALQLLPGSRGPFFHPRRHLGPRPPVRGEWIPD